MTQSGIQHLRLLGPVRVDKPQETHSETQENDGAAVPRFRSRRTVGVLGYLVTERRFIARDNLAALFWPDEAPTRGRANLSRELHNLSQILPDCWELDRQAVAFVPPADTTVDLYQLQELEIQERWVEAAELVAGEFLEGVYLDENPEFENWLLAERERWRGCAAAILTHVMDGYILRGRYSEALRHGQRLLQLTPWNEEAHRQVMRLLAWTGKRGAALRQFKTCKRLMREELDVDPALETETLCQLIQAGQLNLPPQLPAFLSEEKARRKFERPPFVARKDELKRLEDFLTSALNGTSQIVMVTGGPGRGKTALLDAFAQRSLKAYPNLLVASGSCTAYSGLGDPYLPFRDVMSMLTGDVEAKWDAGTISRDHARRLWAAFPLVIQMLLDHGPHLLDVLIPVAPLLSRAMATGQDHQPWLPRLKEHVKRDWTSSEELEQSQLFQQVADVLRDVSHKQPLLLSLDDFQWADAASISLLFHLARRIADADSRLLIICAYRPEEVAIGRSGERHPLAKPLKELKRVFGDVWVDLGQTDTTEDRNFVDELLDSEPNRLTQGFRKALFRRTEGHPLFTIELLRAMQERGDLHKDQSGHWIEESNLNWELLPTRVEAVIEERLNQLDPNLQELLTIASVEGEVFSAQVLAEVKNVSEKSILRRLSQELEREHRLVRGQEEIETSHRRIFRYRFGHGLFQDYLYKQLGVAEQRLLHGDIAAALEKLYEGQQDEIVVQLAHHFYQAEDFEKTFHYASLAAARAASVYDNGEAITHYTRAIQVAEEISPDVVSLAELYRGRGLAYERLGEFNQANADHTAILRIANIAGEHMMEWRATLDLGMLWSSQDFIKARMYFESALEQAARLGETSCLVESLNWMGNWCVNDGDPNAAVSYHQQALDILEDLDRPQELANTLKMLAFSNLVGSDLLNSMHNFDRAVALFREMDDRPKLASCLIDRANIVSALTWLTLVPPTPLPDAAIDLEEGLRFAREVSSVSDQAFAHFLMGVNHRFRGHFGRAFEELQHGYYIASEIGHRHHVVGVRLQFGMLYGELFTLDEALNQLEAALTLARELRSPTWTQAILGAFAGVYLMLDDREPAENYLETAISIKNSMDTIGQRYCWLRRAELALMQDDPALALDITERLIASAPGMSPGRVIPYLWKVKGETLAALRCREDAVVMMNAALECVQETGERSLLWRIHNCLARLYRSIGNQQEAESSIVSARAIIDELAGTIPDETLKVNYLQGANKILCTSEKRV